MPWRGPETEGERPTLGFEVIDWIEAHCVIPDGDYQGDPFILSEEQRSFILNLYELHPDALERMEADVRHRPNRSFTYSRGGLLVAPQKHGKGPFSAVICCAEAFGPVLFAGWNVAGEPVGRPWMTPLIAVTAQSEEQSKNIWDALLWTIRLGPLEAEIIGESGDKEAVGLSRVNLRDGGRIDRVTASPKSRQGARITFAAQDEVQTGIEVERMKKLADTQYRSLAGMGGRFLQTCNAWDPAEKSVAQETWEKSTGVYKTMIEAGPGSIKNKAERMRVLKRAYESSPWVDLELISTTIDDFIARGDVAQAERYFFNRVVPGEDRVVDPELWAACEIPPADPGDDPARVCKAHPRSFHARGCHRALITLGVDGARYVDALAIIATEVETGYQWPIGIWERPPGAPQEYEHPADEIDGAMIETFDRYNVWKAYVDPGSQLGNISYLVDRWIGRWPDKRFYEWLMTRPRVTAQMIRDYVSAIRAGDVKHPGHEVFTKHVLNARRRKTTAKDEDGLEMWLAAKEFPGSPNKMDAFAAGALSWEARGAAIAEGVLEAKGSAYDGDALCRCDKRQPVPHLWLSGTCPA